MSHSYDEFITTVEAEAHASHEEAERAVQAVLKTLAERISAGEMEDIARELPSELRPFAHDGAKAEPFGFDEFVRRVAQREGVEETTAGQHARAVFAALGRWVRRKELNDMAAQLPEDFEELVAVAEAGAVQGRPKPQPQVTADEFVARVAERAGLDSDRARRATEAVLETLAERITGGQVDDLVAWLPSEFRAPTRRGDERTNGAARKMSLDEFVRAVAEREAATPDEARAHARAVFATLREVVPDKEFDDTVAQLPDEFAVLLARP